MPKTILLEELHLTVVAPIGLCKPEYKAMLRARRSKRFRDNLLEAARSVIRRHKSLKKTRISIHC